MLASVFRTVIVYVAVITAMRLMGKRQLGELQPAELVTTFLISNVASICIDEPDLPLAASIVPIFLLTALEILNSTLAWFCPRYARLLFGKPITVIVRGEIRQQALQELRITASDLMEALRGKEYFSPAELLWATVEPNGSISTAPASTKFLRRSARKSLFSATICCRCCWKARFTGRTSPFLAWMSLGWMTALPKSG